MTTLQGEGGSLEAHLCAAPPPADYAELGMRLKLVNDELQALEEQWLTVTDQLESVSA